MSVSSEIVEIPDNNGSPPSINESSTQNELNSALPNPKKSTIRNVVNLVISMAKCSKTALKLNAQEKREEKFTKLKEDGKSPSRLNLSLTDEVMKLHKSPIFESTSWFRDLESLFEQLDPYLKVCLLCFSIFPEDAVIQKRVMIYWWLGEGFVPPISSGDERTDYDTATEFFNELIAKGFIEPVHENQRPGVRRWFMRPLVRCAVIKLAEKARFLNFDDEGKVNSHSQSRLFLVGEGLIRGGDWEWETISTVFNVSENCLYLKPKLFSRLENVRVLLLGKWQDDNAHYIEVDDDTFLSGLKNMKSLRLFSVQGISGIKKLPDTILELTNLTILDLRGCQNLVAIPQGIGSLERLTHLDISECYLLDDVPKSVALLTQLQVLKGFLVGFSDDKGSSCSLDDLGNLQRLKKLSVIVGVKDFPMENHLNALNKCRAIRKLTIEWGERESFDLKTSSKNNRKVGKKENPRDDELVGEEASVDFPTTFSLNLEKLDLLCFPRTVTPTWLKSRNLKCLKKLYIRGGELCDVGQFKELDDDDCDDEKEGGQNYYKWTVEVLRLWYLSKLEMDWSEMQDLFPDLICLEKVKCPKLTFFPCDENGMWMKQTS